MALGWIAFSYDWDWVGAERELKRAIELEPTSTDAHRAYAHLLSNMGRHEEAILEITRARERDPRGMLVRTLEAQFLFYAGRYDEADERLRRAVEMDPDFWTAHQGLGRGPPAARAGSAGDRGTTASARVVRRHTGADDAAGVCAGDRRRAR